MTASSAVRHFFGAYQRAYESLDATTIAALFAYPFQMISDEGQITTEAVSTREAWLPQIGRLVAAYRAIGVASAEILRLDAVDLTPRLKQATVRWRLANVDGARLYDFTATYTLIDGGDGLRVGALAHNEALELRPLLAAKRRA
jgi:hypothetical protein